MMINYCGLSLEKSLYTVGELKQLRGHCEAIMYFDELAAAGRVSHCSFEAISDYGWGFPHFVSHVDVETSTATRQCLKNDTIVFRLPKIVVHK